MRRSADHDASLIKRFGFASAPLGAIKIGNITQALRYGEMVRPERLFQNCQAAEIQRFRLGLPRAPVIEPRQIVEDAGGPKMLRRQILLENAERASV